MAETNPNLIFKRIRAEANDIFNRLHSVYEDSQFVSSVADAFPAYPLFANQRCGAWYTDKNKARPEFVYFKSTDGHQGQWSFNLRRANLHLLPIVQASGGMILADSTRAGKRLPDALSKTIPLWCAVINKAIEIREGISNDRWKTFGGLFTPPTSVSRSEHDQMAQLIPDFAEKLLASSFPLTPLTRPLRPFWITPQSTPLSLPSSDLEFFPVICVSASKLVADGLERRSNGFVYIQGSGDDHESWSLGLSPELFWNNCDRLLRCDKDNLPDTIAKIVKSSPSGDNAVSIIPIEAVHGKLVFSSCELLSPVEIRPFDGTIRISSPLDDQKAVIMDEQEDKLEISMSNSKQNQTFYVNRALPAVHEFGRRLYKGNDHRLLVVDTTGTYDASIGIMMVLLACFFQESGEMIQSSETRLVTKESLRTRLEWIQSSLPRANPSRTTMKRVNEYAISMKLPSHRLSMAQQYDQGGILQA